MHDYKKLRVWQEARVLVREVYALTAPLPKPEEFGLMSRSRRAAVAIPSNVAEGSGRATQADYARFVDVAVGSACELETLLLLAGDRGMLAAERTRPVLERLIRARRMLVRFRQRLRKNRAAQPAPPSGSRNPESRIPNPQSRIPNP